MYVTQRKVCVEIGDDGFFQSKKKHLRDVCVLNKSNVHSAKSFNLHTF